MKKALVTVLGSATVALTASAAVTITKVGEYDIEPYHGCGAIAYLGGDNYWLLSDHADGTGKPTLYPATITVDPKTGAITDKSIGNGIVLTGCSDAEGLGYDPCSGGVWVSDEIAPAVGEYRPVLAAESVPRVRSAPLPSVYSKVDKTNNKGLEALTVSGDGKTMWLANEEALQGDGALSSYNVSTTVRLTKFARENVHDNWTAVGQWPYTCEPAKSSLVSSYQFCGVSGLCALPDGSLLVLERETSTTTLGRFEIYRLTESSFTSATPILTWTDGLAGKSYTAVSKGKALISNVGDDRESVYSDFDIDVYEGICLGPRLNDGSLSVLLVADGGASAVREFIFTWTAYTVPRLCALRLSGLGEVDTVDIPAPEKGTASIEGRNYRFMKGTVVTSKITGLPEPVETAYTNRGAVAETGHASWTATGSSGGSGSTMTFTVAGDVQAKWTVVTEVETNLTSQLLANDSFEGYAEGTGVASLAGWTDAEDEGSGTVVAEAYAPPAVGYPLGREAHTKVLALEDAAVERAYDVDADSRASVDMMVSVVRASRMPAVDETQDQTAVAVDTDGFFCLCHRDGDGKIAWTRISDETFENGAWVRLGVTIDYADDNHAYLRPRINGALSTAGVAAPSSGAAQGGPWFRAVTDKGVDGKGRIRSLALTGNCKVDDIVIGASGWKQEGIEDGEPSIPSEQGTLSVEDGVATVVPAPGKRHISVSNGESLTAVVLPPSVETIVGVPPQKIVIRAFGHDITGAFTITGDACGVTIALNPDGKVTIDDEEIPVRPQLSSVAGTQDAPFVVGSGDVKIGIKSIPGLIYRLKRGADVSVRTTGLPIGEPQTAEATRLSLEDVQALPDAAFYLISVTR